jgi:invasion protein IalB
MAQGWLTELRLAAAAAMLSLVTVGATAQEASPPAVGGDTAAAGQRENWASRCVAIGRDAALECSIEQRLIMQTTSQLVAAVTVRMPSDTRRPVMMLQTPLGLYLPAGVTIDIDGAGEQKFELQTCDNNGCYAGNPVSDDLIASMMRGQNLNIRFQNLNRQPVTVTATLSGFTAAYQRIR